MVGFKDIYLIRHGELVNSESGVLNGQRDIELSERGLKDTLAWIEYLQDKKIALILSSDLKRTKIPAKIYAERLTCNYKALKELREIKAGRWEGLTYSEIMNIDKEYLEKRYKDPVKIPFPEGESLKDLKKRVLKTLKAFLKNSGNILLVSHAGVIRVIILGLLEISLKNFFKFEVDYGSLSMIRIFDDGNTLLKFHNLKRDN